MASQAGAEAAGQATHTVGMPQLDVATFPNQIFWLVITLLVIWWVLSRIALPRIGAVLAERSGTITNDLASAEELSLKVKEAEAAYARALAEARAEAGRIAAAARAEIDADLAEAMERADTEIATRTAKSEKAIAAIHAESADAIRKVAEDTAAEIVAALGGKAPSGDALGALVAQRMKG